MFVGSIKSALKQALSLAPKLHDELVSNSKQDLAKISFLHIAHICVGGIAHESGRDNEPGTAAVVVAISI